MYRNAAIKLRKIAEQISVPKTKLFDDNQFYSVEEFLEKLGIDQKIDLVTNETIVAKVIDKFFGGLAIGVDAQNKKYQIVTKSGFSKIKPQVIKILERIRDLAEKTIQKKIREKELVLAASNDIQELINNLKFEDDTLYSVSEIIEALSTSGVILPIPSLNNPAISVFMKEFRQREKEIGSNVWGNYDDHYERKPIVGKIDQDLLRDLTQKGEEALTSQGINWEYFEEKGVAPEQIFKHFLDLEDKDLESAVRSAFPQLGLEGEGLGDAALLDSLFKKIFVRPANSLDLKIKENLRKISGYLPELFEEELEKVTQEIDIEFVRGAQAILSFKDAANFDLKLKGNSIETYKLEAPKKHGKYKLRGKWLNRADIKEFILQGVKLSIGGTRFDNILKENAKEIKERLRQLVETPEEEKVVKERHVEFEISPIEKDRIKTLKKKFNDVKEALERRIKESEELFGSSSDKKLLEDLEEIKPLLEKITIPSGPGRKIKMKADPTTTAYQLEKELNKILVFIKKF